MDILMQIIATVPYLFEVLANVEGKIHVAAAAIAAGVGVGMVGAKAAEAVGRNPGALAGILTIGIIIAALAEGLIFLAIFIA